MVGVLTAAALMFGAAGRALADSFYYANTPNVLWWSVSSGDSTVRGVSNIRSNTYVEDL